MELYYKRMGFGGIALAMDSGMKIPPDLILNVEAEAGDSIVTLRAKAQSQVQNAIRAIGELAGEKAWKKLEQTYGRPDGNKFAFIRQSGAEAITHASAEERRNVEDEIFERLKKERAEKAAGK
jgi:hypothetical protein